MDFGRSFTFMFRQPGAWPKILIGGRLLLVPIVGWVWVAGYALRMVRAVMHGDESLPEWADWGELFGLGLIPFLSSLIYGIPGAILGRLGAPGATLSSLWGIIVTVVLPAAIMRFAAKADFGAFFDFKEIYAFIRQNLSNYIVVMLLSILASIIASFGVILLIIGVLFTYFWAVLVSTHLYGSLARESGLAAQFGTPV